MAVRARRTRRPQIQIGLQTILHPEHYGLPKTAHHNAYGGHHRDRSRERPHQHGGPPHGRGEAANRQQSLHAEHTPQNTSGDGRQSGDQRGDRERRCGDQQNRRKVAEQRLARRREPAGMRAMLRRRAGWLRRVLAICGFGPRARDGLATSPQPVRLRRPPRQGRGPKRQRCLRPLRQP